MRRSSWLVLIAAFALLLLGGIFYFVRPTAPQPLNAQVAARLLEEAKEAFQHNDTNAVMALFTEDSQIMGLSTSLLRSRLEQTMHEIGNDHLQIRWNNVSAQAEGGRGMIACDIDVGQTIQQAEISYFKTHVTLLVRRIRTAHLFGLWHSEEWRIAEVQADPVIVPNQP